MKIAELIDLLEALKNVYPDMVVNAGDDDGEGSTPIGSVELFEDHIVLWR